MTARMDVSDTVGVNGDAARQIPPPPSPVTGCYLLIVVGEPHSDEHKDIILQRIAKGLLLLAYGIKYMNVSVLSCRIILRLNLTCGN